MIGQRAIYVGHPANVFSINTLFGVLRLKSKLEWE